MEHLRLAASVLVESGVSIDEIQSLTDLVQPERFKTILRYYIRQANGQPNAFTICLATTLIQVSQFHVGATPDVLADSSGSPPSFHPSLAGSQPKNNTLLRQFEFRPSARKSSVSPEDKLVEEFTKTLARRAGSTSSRSRWRSPSTSNSLSRSGRKISAVSTGSDISSEPDGPNGRLLLHIPALETKSRREDFIAEVPEHVAKRLRWYRRHVLPRLNADLNGDLFVTKAGCRKDQKTLTIQIIKTIERCLGIHMTTAPVPALQWCLLSGGESRRHRDRPAMLGHAWSKTTLVYVGSSSRRASRAYNRFVFEKRDALKLKRKRQRNRKSEVRDRRDAHTEASAA